MRKFLNLKASVAPMVLGIAMVSAPAVAQEQTDVNAEDSAEGNVIVVTGSIIRRTDANSPSPVTILSAESLSERGINTVADAVQLLPSNGAGTIAKGWNTGFNFASGATAPALRGLTVQNTLSISDGLRMAPYPLADDGQRNFVDINTIPSAIIDRIEILRDGASSTYGADAIAGVINIITKKQVEGLHLNGSVGVSQRGDAGEQRIDVTYGYGDLNDQGYNFYVSGEYQKNDPLYARDRGYPFNTSDLQGICASTGSCMSNNNWNGTTAEDGSFNGFIDVPGVAFARPVDPAQTGPGAIGNGRYQYLNVADGCRNWPTNTISAGDSPTSPLTTCEVDSQDAYQLLQPGTTRKGLTARFTANVGDNAQVYAIGNFYQTDTSAARTPGSFRNRPTAPRGDAVVYNVIAPVYVCADGVGTIDGLNTGCDAVNGVLNPNNPFAAAGDRAQLSFRSDRQGTTDTRSRVLRGVIGIDGTIDDSWNYSASFTASQVQLDRTQANYFIPQRIMDVVAQGTFDFVNPSNTPEAIWDYIAPISRVRSTSDLIQATASISKDLFELPGGTLQAAVGGQYREESINAPSANPQDDANPYDRYYSLNAVGTAGSRNVKSAFFEINAPVLDILEINASGRYDDYSTGQSNFSPKIGARLQPIPQLAIRGTFSKGFRIPSFNESFGLPTTGFVTRTLDPAIPAQAAFIAAHGGNSYATNNFSLGLTQTGNPSLDPEKSTSFTAGVIVEPVDNLSLTVDFWQIKVKNLIVGVTDTQPAFDAYYANNGVVNIPGLTVTQGAPDPQFPNALPQIGEIQSSFQNADSQLVRGIDFGAQLAVPIGNTATLNSNFQASYLMKYELTSNGTTLRYDGTLSPCNITSCSGAPKWRATWQNTLAIGDTTLSATAYYTKGYDMASIDFGGVKGDCVGNIGVSVQTAVDNTPIQCHSKDVWNLDFTASQKINDKFTLYMNVLNVLDIDAPLDTAAAYSLLQFNPAWSGANIQGRYFRIGAKVDF